MTGTVGQDNDRGTVTDRNRDRVTGGVGQDNDRGTVTDRNRDRVTGGVGQDNDRGTVTDRNRDSDRNSWTRTEGPRWKERKERAT